jgi:TetR/AcrR family transcriptional regulator
MINWTFTWMKPGGTLTHDTLAPIVAELFFGGLPAISPPPVVARKRRARATAAESA